MDGPLVQFHLKFEFQFGQSNQSKYSVDSIKRTVHLAFHGFSIKNTVYY